MKPTVWRNAIRDSELDRTAKLVAYTISTYMNGAGAAWPAKETIARGAGLGKGRRAVDQAVDRIEAAGYLEVARSKGRRSFTYCAAVPNAAPGAMSNVAGDATLGTANLASDDTQRRTDRQPTSHAVRSNVARAATESGLESESESGSESVGPAPARIDECDECGERGTVAEWGDGCWLCEPCGAARFAASGFGAIGRPF